MKKFAVVAELLALSLALTGCGVQVHPGYAGVKIDNYGDNKGKPEVFGPGRYHPGWNAEILEFPVFTQNEVWTKNVAEGKPLDESLTFQTKEGTSINADFGMAFHIDQDNVGKVFYKYHKGIEEISDIVLRNMLRDTLVEAASGQTLDDLMTGKAKFMGQVNVQVAKRAALDGITVESVSAVGEFRWPKPIVDAMNAKMQATQNAMMVENQLRQTEAEAKKSIVKAEAALKVSELEAQATSLKAAALNKNPEIIQQMAIEKWDGHLPVTMTGNAVPFIYVK